MCSESIDYFAAGDAFTIAIFDPTVFGFHGSLINLQRRCR